MKTSEFIRANYDRLHVYIWDTGDIECQEAVRGDRSWLAASDSNPHELYFVCTVEVEPSFNLWDVAGEAIPEDETEAEEKRQEIIDWLVDEYKQEGASAVLDAEIEDREKGDD